MHDNNKRSIIWNIGQPDAKKSSELAKKLGISEFLAKLLVSKGIEDADEAMNFMNCDYMLLHDPFLLPDMDKAAKRIHEAIDKKEKILIYGDYDVDGITSVAVLYLYFKSKGIIAEYYIPERINEGYGLNKQAIDKFAESGIKLIITVDSGITAFDEVNYAKEHGIDVVITDHHECHEDLPDAFAVVNPHRNDSKYPFCELAGVGVVFKLVCALEKNKNLRDLCSKYCDIVSLGTIADVMPVTGENRIIVKIGLDKIEKSSNLGLNALIESSVSVKKTYKTKRITSYTIGFILAPRINAAGRIGDVNKAIKLLITENPQEAENIADYLCALNRERQLVENLIFEQAVSKIESDGSYADDKVLVLTSDTWHIGVIGIVASKITEKYGLPSILISFDGDVGKASGRSIKGFNINEAISQCKDLVIKYGGHELAAGLSISRENVDAFRKKINEYAKSVFDFENVCTYINADMELTGKEVSVENTLESLKLEPFGMGNAEPVFYMESAKISEIYSIGEGKHLKLILEHQGEKIYAVYFNMPINEFPFGEGMKADFIFTLGYNDFRGCITVQMVIKDVRPEKSEYREKTNQLELFEKIMKGEEKCPCEHIPNLMSFRTVFMYIKNACAACGGKLSVSSYFMKVKINSEYKTNISLCSLNIALEVFKEMNLIKLHRYNDVDDVDIEIIPTSEKVDLNDSLLLKRIKG